MKTLRFTSSVTDGAHFPLSALARDERERSAILAGAAAWGIKYEDPEAVDSGTRLFSVRVNKAGRDRLAQHRDLEEVAELVESLLATVGASADEKARFSEFVDNGGESFHYAAVGLVIDVTFTGVA